MRQKIKISKGDYRVGNFVFHKEQGFVKVFDINSTVSHRIATSTTKGMYLALAIEEKKDVWLANYAALVFNALSCVPDAEFMEAVHKATIECVNRHANLYGINPDISKIEDDAITADQKELSREMEALKDGLD